MITATVINGRNPLLGVSLKVEYITSTKVTSEVKSLLFGCILDNYSTIGPSPPHAVDFEASGWRRNCAGLLTVVWVKGGQRLTSLEKKRRGV
ncbi:hypothetical protein TNCV_1915241 [Trichonephila clavipes]|uniref:Uncharacterized protein n=1 Tax=Trichonephila clavipes TaxID=2585209 RepID=A0A8X7BCM2_TRICX|nr:hypothetical protein TNCV_1915241 [Trichonephila clavipes]